MAEIHRLQATRQQIGDGTRSMPLFRGGATDVLSLVLKECDFDTLITLLAVNAHLRDHAMLVFRCDAAWRGRLANSERLQLAAFAVGEVEEACLGAHSTSTKQLSIDGHHIATCAAHTRFTLSTPGHCCSIAKN